MAVMVADLFGGRIWRVEDVDLDFEEICSFNLDTSLSLSQNIKVKSKNGCNRCAICGPPKKKLITYQHAAELATTQDANSFLHSFK
jgi:hypothetical protein